MCDGNCNGNCNDCTGGGCDECQKCCEGCVPPSTQDINDVETVDTIADLTTAYVFIVNNGQLVKMTLSDFFALIPA